MKNKIDGFAQTFAISAFCLFSAVWLLSCLFACLFGYLIVRLLVRTGFSITVEI